MMGIPMSAPSYIYGDNMSAVHNISKPESVLRKKVTQFAIMLVMSRWLWASPEKDTYSAVKISQT